MENNNKFSTVIFWRSIQGVGQQLLQLTISIVLARLLAPEDFGKMAVLTIFFIFATTLIDSGLGVALVREKNIEHIDYDTVFTFNILTSIVLYFVIFLIAPFVSHVFNDSDLILLTRIVGIKILISAFSIINYSKLRRDLNLKAIAIVAMSSVLFGGLIAIIMAYLKYGVWAIVAQQLIMSLVLFIGYFVANKKERYKFRFSLISFKKLFSFGGYILLATLISRLSDHLYAVLIGRYYTLSDVGYFNRAQSLHKLPIITVNKSIVEGAAPKLYQMQQDKQLLMVKAREIFRLINFIVTPLIVGMYIMSNNLVILLLTDKWAASIPFFKIFLIASLFYSHNYFSQLIFKAIGKSKLFFKIELISKIIFILSLLVAVNFGISAFAWTAVLTGLILVVLNMFYLEKNVEYSYSTLFQDFKYAYFTSILMGFILLAFNYVYKSESKLIIITLNALFGTVTYLSINIILKNETSLILKKKIKELIMKV